MAEDEEEAYLDGKLQHFRAEGYAVLEGAIEHALCDELAAQIKPLRTHIIERDRAASERYVVPEGVDVGGGPVQVVTESGREMEVEVPPEAQPGMVLETCTNKDVWGVYGHAGDPLVGMGEMVGHQRFHLNLPFVAPFTDETIIANPLVMRFMKKLWGGESPALTVLYCNGPSPGSTYQRWHRDSATDFYDLPEWLVRPNGDPFAIGVNIPLADRTEANGATDVVAGTHKLSPLLGYGGRQPHRPVHEHDYNKLLIDGRFHEVLSADGLLTKERVHRPRRMVLKKGDIWLHDPRIFHRGTPNHSEHATYNLLLTYRSQASPSPIRGFFGRQLTAGELARTPADTLSTEVESMVAHARGGLPDRRPLARGARL